MRLVRARRIYKNFFNLSSHLSGAWQATKTVVRRTQGSIYLKVLDLDNMARKGGYYAVQNGRHQGVFNSWEDCKEQVSGYPGARYKRFDSLAEAQQFSNCNKVVHSVNINRSSSIAGSNAVIKKYERAKPVSRVNKPKYYSVKSSNINVPSRIFNNWNECQRYVKGKKGLSFKKFEDEKSAKNFMDGSSDPSVDFEHIGIQEYEFRSRYRLPSESPEFKRISNVYCDGSALSNGTRSSTAGYGVFFDDDTNYQISERLKSGPQTNNRAEIKAVSCALDKIWNNLQNNQDKLNYQIKTDSEYVAKLLNDRYASYTDDEFKAIPNRDLILPLVKTFTTVKQYYKINSDKFSNGGKFIIQWVKGHAGEPGNERADELARRGAMKS